MTEMIFLGAGASIDAGVPAAYDMTKQVLGLFENDRNLVKHTQVLRFVVGGLLFQEGVQGRDPFNGINVEELFNAIELLATRDQLEASPFIGSWHQRIKDLDRVEISSQDTDELKDILYQAVLNDLSIEVNEPTWKPGKIDQEIGNLFAKLASRHPRPASPGKEIIDILNELKLGLKNRHRGSDYHFRTRISTLVNRVSQTGGGRIFQETSRHMIQRLVDMVWIDDVTKTDYLSPLISYAGKNNLVIASLNYDNAIELAANKANMPLTTGIETWSNTGQFSRPQNGIYLLKLHGSIDWHFKQMGSSPDKPMPHQIIEKIPEPTKTREYYQPALIFGQRNKLTAKGPFLDLLQEFNRALQETKQLTIIGYSFRDEHINEIIGQWLNGARDRHLRIINGSKFAQNPPEFIQTIHKGAMKRIQLTQYCAADGIKEFYDQ